MSQFKQHYNKNTQLNDDFLPISYKHWHVLPECWVNIRAHF